MQTIQLSDLVDISQNIKFGLSYRFKDLKPPSSPRPLRKDILFLFLGAAWRTRRFNKFSIVHYLVIDFHSASYADLEENVVFFIIAAKLAETFA